MGYPQIILIVLYAMSFGITLARHGQSRPNYNVNMTLTAMTLNAALLYWGGFWG